MSNVSNRAEGIADEIGGKIKKVVGALLGNDRMEAAGRAQELKGEARQAAAKTLERVKGTAEELVGGVQNRVGEVLDDARLEAQGKAKELEGRGRKAGNR